MTQEKNSEDIFETVISTIGSGVGFVTPPHDPEDVKDVADLVIPTDYINNAYDGDTVKVKPRPDIKNDRGDLMIGEVVEVVRRARTQFVGTIQRNGNTYFLLPDKKHMYQDIFVRTNEEIPDGHKVLVEITDWGDINKDRNPAGKVIEVLGPKGDHEVEIKSILMDKGIEVDFPDDVMAEAAELEDWSMDDVDLSERRDFRDVLTMTIDPVTAKDFDDAITFQRQKDGNYKIGVHIADVSHFVQPGTAIDREARKRSFSAYLVDRTIPMLPPILSNDLCSLNPNLDRLAFSAEFTVSPEGNVLDRWFGKGIIHSDKRFTYEQAQKQIDSGNDEFSDELLILNNIAKTFRNRRFSNGSINFHGEEVEFDITDDGTVLSITKKEHMDTHELVEEYMLLANREIAKEIHRMTEDEDERHFFVYRVHGLPDRDRLAELGVFLRALGYDFELEKGAEITHSDINALLNQAEGKAEEGLVNTEVIRTMDKAIYETTNKGHFGLAFEYYTHFTSPIRRYPDLLVHRLLYKHLNDIPVPPQEFNFYQSAAKHASEREREVMDAERDSISFKRAEYMENHIGEEFTAVISGISKRGFYVEEKKTLANGMVSMRSLNDDYYELDKENYALVGRDSGRTFTLGDEVKVKLTKVNIDNREIDFSLVESD
ncbi:MAG: ribonuclease R [Candidatus Paceibacterota bacterium]